MTFVAEQTLSLGDGRNHKNDYDLWVCLILVFCHKLLPKYVRQPIFLFLCFMMQTQKEPKEINKKSYLLLISLKNQKTIFEVICIFEVMFQ